MKKNELIPTKLRMILSISLFLIAGIGAGLFYVANNELTSVAIDVSRAVSKANASSNNIQSLRTVQNELAKQKDAIARANNIAADSQSYNYQNQIISDLNTYAGRAGIGITNIDFSGAGGATSSTSPTQVAPGVAMTAPSGLRTATVSVTLKNPVNYTRLLSFFNMIEQSVPKLQISKVNLTKSTDGGADSISSDVLTIEVYIR
jgi:hypothetical protein